MKNAAAKLIFAIASAWIYIRFAEPHGARLNFLVIAAVFLASLTASFLSQIPNRFIKKESLKIGLSTILFLGSFPFIGTALIHTVSVFEWNVVESGVDTIYFGTSGMQHGDLFLTAFASFLPGIAYIIFQTVNLIRNANQPKKRKHCPLTAPS